MKQTRTVARSVRLAQLQHTLSKHPKGLTSRELADSCGVCVRTVQRDLIDLQCYLNIPLTQNGDRYGIVSDYALPAVSFSADDAVALFLACRLALRQADKNNLHMGKALDKMASIMPPELASRLNIGIEDRKEEVDDNLAKVFEAVGLAWINERQVKLSYLSARDNQLREWVLEPYFMEMSGAGRSTYVIGHACTEGIEGLISFRLDRVKTAEILPVTFEAPSDENLEMLLSSAWGTMWKEQTEVRFELPGTLTRQSRERDAHLPQSIVGSPGDSATVALHISSWMEVHPWLRNTTSKFEELTPELMKRYFDEHVEKLAQSCGLKPDKFKESSTISTGDIKKDAK